MPRISVSFATSIFPDDRASSKIQASFPGYFDRKIVIASRGSKYIRYSIFAKEKKHDEKRMETLTQHSSTVIIILTSIKSSVSGQQISLQFVDEKE